MTDALYLDSTADRTFEATVERAVDDRVVLDRTLFYPEGGGQPNDTGTLTARSSSARASEGSEEDENAALGSDERTWTVTDVQKKDTVYHTVSGTPPREGTTVIGRLDWDRRYSHMRYHTAQHLLSALLLDVYDARTTGNQLYADRARIDCEYDRFTGEEFEEIEARMNERIDDALPVEWYRMDRDAAEQQLDPERTRIRLLPDTITEVRIVEIGEYDRTACAGTHVSNTERIGRFELTGRETKGSDEERLTFTLNG